MNIIALKSPSAGAGEADSKEDIFQAASTFQQALHWPSMFLL